MSGNVPTLVEDELNKVKGDDITNIEVINTGTSSYSPTLYYLLTKYKILKYKPDLIIVNIDMTDDFDDWKYSETLITDGQGKPIACPRRDVVNSAYIDTENGAVEMTLNTKIQFYLMLNSYSFNFLTKVRNKLVKNDIKKTEFKNNEMYQRWSWCKYVWDDSTKANVNRTFDLLKELVSLCRSNNAKIMFTSIPHYQQYNSDIESGIKPLWSSLPHTEIEKLSLELNVPYLNLFKKLHPKINGTIQTKYYYKDDMHFNPDGYLLWANAQIEFLKDSDNKLMYKEFY